ncbi:hypothetical protein STEG23_010128, partial [Scotinomys teguina]
LCPWDLDERNPFFLLPLSIRNVSGWHLYKGENKPDLQICGTMRYFIPLKCLWVRRHGDWIE